MLPTRIKEQTAGGERESGGGETDEREGGRQQGRGQKDRERLGGRERERGEKTGGGRELRRERER